MRSGLATVSPNAGDSTWMGPVYYTQLRSESCPPNPGYAPARWPRRCCSCRRCGADSPPYPRMRVTRHGWDLSIIHSFGQSLARRIQDTHLRGGLEGVARAVDAERTRHRIPECG